MKLFFIKMIFRYKEKSLGSIGDFGTYSFHETKNVISGEGGALLINNNYYENFAEIIREKGTDRSKFFRGEIDKYTWQASKGDFDIVFIELINFSIAFQ